MAQLVVRNLPDDVKERLKRRAQRHGHSLEAEVRLLLSQAQEIPPERGESGSWVNVHVRKLAQIGVADEDIETLNDSMAELRHSWRMREFEQ